MAKSLTLLKVTKASELADGVATARTKVKALGINMDVKPINLNKVGPFLEKAKKGEFQLTADVSFAKLVFQCGSMTTALGVESLKGGKAEDRLKLYDKLVKQGAMDKAGPDLLRAILARQATYNGLKSLDDVIKAKLMDDFRKFTAEIYVTENLDFLTAVAKNEPRATLMAKYISQRASDQINIDSTLRTEIESGKKEPKAAVPVIKALLSSDTIPKYRKQRTERLDEMIADMT